MKELTVFDRLGLGYLAILLIVFTLGVYATLKLGHLSQIIHSISSADKEIIETASRLRDEILSQRGFERKYGEICGQISF
jgi:CHASE3 domain sensor protein